MLGVALVSSQLLAPPPARAAGGKLSRRQIQRLINQGETHFLAKRYREALTDYEAAYEASKADALLYMVGRCHEELNQIEQAIDAYERFIASRAPTKHKARAKGAVRLLKKRLAVGQLILQLAPFGADVSVDGAPVGTAPVAPLELAPGPHEVVVAATGHATHRETVTVQGGRETVLTVELEPAERLGRLMLSVSPPGAEVLIDGRSVGRAPLGPLEVGEGQHEIRVRHREHRAQVRTVEVTADDTLKLAIALEPDAGFAPWSWVVAGAGLAVAVGGSVAFLLGEADHQKVTDLGGASVGAPSDWTQRRADALVAEGDDKKLIGYVLWGVGGAALVTGVSLAIADAAGGEPGEGRVEAISVVPRADGLTWVMQGSF